VFIMRARCGLTSGFLGHEAEKKLSHRDSFDEEINEATRVFQFTCGDRADTGDEHILFSEAGKEICKFAGVAG
jgi:hypothetical protein